MGSELALLSFISIKKFYREKSQKKKNKNKNKNKNANLMQAE